MKEIRNSITMNQYRKVVAELYLMNTDAEIKEMSSSNVTKTVFYYSNSMPIDKFKQLVLDISVYCQINKLPSWCVRDGLFTSYKRRIIYVYAHKPLSNI